MKPLNYLLAIIMVGVLFSACISSNPTPAEETEVRGVVEGFGQSFKMVSLLASSAATDMKTQYSEYVSSALLDQWGASPETTPGRIVSSPWPDRIEITSIKSTKPDEYSVTGNVVELTSAEVSGDSYTDKIPVRITLQKSNDRWLIVGYVQSTPLP